MAMIRIVSEFRMRYFCGQIPAGPQGFFLLADNKSDTFVKRSFFHNKTHNPLKSYSIKLIPIY